ncbi:ATP-binding cassette domain-containing protein [Neobacillus thermocopriae]|uniref:ATP-binding cassette domain-containing protein n=1 Tax=Neobacillus thermocopriae TaxID=1215031 RepID=A0A6B3TRL6_9BACI|nr:ATP-binding cassette domain-containing protein [Neobacillus thermocopriae]MED3623206.1 ATP-binding cassette domain-containing protein [Neobacillus thermocopriae]MED3715284.1 ATP-binding cassette domain-containing protein [Neobacillus thermocopriae]NEX79625.1 ATP-binding cassette domain-containing protein [Neobacillus thermocopriae]
MSVALKLENINKHYTHHVLSDVNYTFSQTGLYAIYGISGSGKSTLLNLIAGFDTPDSGRIHSSYHGLEYVMQEHMLLTNITVRENLYLKLNLTNKKVSEYDSLILDTCKKLSIEQLIDKKVSVLSGGEKQRVSLARALLNVPDVILLDEPTASIDHDLKSDLLKLLLQLSKEKLIIVTTHDPLVKEYADITLYLERGHLHE